MTTTATRPASGAPDQPFTVLIPARMASTRLPDKPLADLLGLPMIVRVAQQARQSQADAVVVATDDARIQHACEQHGIACVMTRSDHPSGSDRLAEAATQLALADGHIVVNVQGDEPLIDPALIDATAALLLQQRDCVMGTAAHPIDTEADFHNPNIVKVVLNAQGQAQYFSRAPIPFARDAATAPNAPFWAAPGQQPPLHPLRHVGIYSYRAGFLRQYPQLPPAPTERLESLEQLRVLWHGHRIAVHTSDTAPAAGVDTPQDLERVRAHLRQSQTAPPAHPHHP